MGQEFGGEAVDLQQLLCRHKAAEAVAVAHDAACEGRSDAVEEHEGGGVGAVELHRQGPPCRCRGLVGVPLLRFRRGAVPGDLPGAAAVAAVEATGTIDGVLFFLQKSPFLLLYGVVEGAVFVPVGRKKFYDQESGQCYCYPGDSVLLQLCCIEFFLAHNEEKFCRVKKSSYFCTRFRDTTVLAKT